MIDQPLPFGSPLDAYEQQTRELGLEADALANAYAFQNSAALSEWVTACQIEGSPVQRFESAVEAIITGDVEGLEGLLALDPELVRARSTIVSNLNPPRHRATLLHYVAANGVESYRQKTPPTAVAIATTLLRAGAEPDALAGMYGGELTTMTMLVSSVHPAIAGLQVALTETLLDFGADVNGRGSGAHWVPPLLTALAFGYPDTADALARRGARVDTVAAAAGLGRSAEVERLLARAEPLDRQRAVVLAAQHGRVDCLALLLASGEDPNRFNPVGFHAHATPLHLAALNGHLPAVQLLVAHGARTDTLDAGFHATPRGWAEHAHKVDVVEYLR